MYYCLHSITLSSILVISLTVYALPMTHCNKSGYCVIKGERMDIVGQQKNGDHMLAFPYRKDLGSCWAVEYLFGLLLPAEFFVSGHRLRDTFALFL